MGPKARDPFKNSVYCDSSTEGAEHGIYLKRPREEKQNPKVNFEARKTETREKMSQMNHNRTDSKLVISRIIKYLFLSLPLPL